MAAFILYTRILFSMAAKNHNMSIFDHYILRKFYRLVKHYTEDLLRSKEEQVEDKVDKIDSRTSRSKLLRREWGKSIRTIREWNASRMKKEVDMLVKRAQGSRTDAQQVREDLDDFLTLSRYKYLEAINPDVNLEEMDIGPPNLETFLSFYLEKLMQDDMVTSRQFLNASVSDRTAVIRSCLTDAVEDSIPSSIHRAILSKKSRRKRKKQQVVHEPKEEEEDQEDQEEEEEETSPTKSLPKQEKAKVAMAPPKPKQSKPPTKRSRRVKEVVLESTKETSQQNNEEKEEEEEDDEEPSQMDVLRQRLAALEERDRKLRAGTYKASGKNHDFELNTNLSSFM